MRRILGLALVLAMGAPAHAGRYRGVIDVGSMTVKLLVTDAKGRVVIDRQIRTRLGKGVKDGRLAEDGRKRTLGALARLKRVAAGYGIAADQLELIATAAVRNTKNGPAFLEQDIKQGLGMVRAQILSGEQEARLGFRGALLDRAGSATYAVIETGGGSHQIVIGTASEILEQGSTQVGAHHVIENGWDDAAMTKAVPTLPVGVTAFAGATPLLTGGIAKYLAGYWRSTRVTRAELEALRARVVAQPLYARVDLLRRDHRGRPLGKKTIDALGLGTVRGTKDFSPDLPAALTLTLRVMTLLGTDHVELSAFDSRHVLAATAAH